MLKEKNEKISVEYMRKQTLSQTVGVIDNKTFLNIIRNKTFHQIKTRKKVCYYNIPASFDIETSSFYKSTRLDNGTEIQEKVAIMYEWTFAIYGYITIGRTWESFKEFYYELCDILNLDTEHRLIVYVHNLSFEFQFMKNRFIWEKVFSLSKRKPIQAITIEGLEFRCSYKLSGYSLAKLGNQLTKYKAKKKDGDLNYDLIRHSETPLTNIEIQYCVCDCLVVNCYILELMEREGDISKLPLTKTGFVRNYCRKECLYDKEDKYSTKFKKYRKIMKSLTLDVDTYEQLKRTFAGGFTHCSPLYAFEVCNNIKSYDFTSSYPYVMIAEKYPMTKFRKVGISNREEFNYYINNKACLFDIEIFDLEPKVLFENYLSKSHCVQLIGQEVNNGRIVRAKHLVTSMTEQDFIIMKKFYTWSSHKIYNFKIAEKQYLPTDFIKAILYMYKVKTELKDVIGKEVEYMKAKEDVNALFGMTVTDICRDEIVYDTEWQTVPCDKEEAISKYNNSIKRFLNYAWGVWVTAYARLNLFTGIYTFGEDYLYADTDSIKVKNYQNHTSYIESYNALVIHKLKLACDYHKIDISETAPKNKKGVAKQLGVWNDEGIYTKFKSIGAKRYLVEKDGKIELTVAGLNKGKVVPYLLEKYGNNIFNEFKENLYIPSKYIPKTIDGVPNTKRIEVSATGKQTHTYIDDTRDGIVRDYLGKYGRYHELSGVHLEPAEYDFSILQEYMNYIFKVKEEIIA